jgi:hypothetical protein
VVTAINCVLELQQVTQIASVVLEVAILTSLVLDCLTSVQKEDMEVVLAAASGQTLPATVRIELISALMVIALDMVPQHMVEI